LRKRLMGYFHGKAFAVTQSAIREFLHNLAL
jgi:hypothetical protein